MRGKWPFIDVNNLHYEFILWVLKKFTEAIIFWTLKTKKIHWDGLIMINYVLNIILIPVQKEQLFAFRDFPHKYLCGKISNWTVILSHSSHQLLKGRKCVKTEGFFSHFAKLWAFFSIPSCSPAYTYIHMQHFLLLLCFPFSTLLEIHLFNMWLSPLIALLILNTFQWGKSQASEGKSFSPFFSFTSGKKPKDSQCALEYIN